ncbi:nucleoredoxin-like [Physella acuta]|uniref:nucleoredoxin-like n=1 Tax=Physella acuta TaxID=109671 RepID=UPI0027DCF4E4|nr:nucleoredoxin-like [Physella acuta]
MRAYETLKSRGEKFQVIFVSADRSEEAFQRHVAGMPWLTVPYDDPRNQAVKKHFGVDGIPMLVLVDEKGNIITMNGRQAVAEDEKCKDFPWYPQPIEELTALSSLHLNENMCVIYFTDGTEPGLKQGRAVLSDAANKEAEKGEERDLFFFVAGEDEISDNVRDFADLDDTCPLLIVLDSPEQNVYICNEVKVTSKIATEFIDKFLRGELTPVPITPLCADGNQASAII